MGFLNVGSDGDARCRSSAGTTVEKLSNLLRVQSIPNPNLVPYLCFWRHLMCETCYSNSNQYDYGFMSN